MWYILILIRLCSLFVPSSLFFLTRSLSYCRTARGDGFETNSKWYLEFYFREHDRNDIDRYSSLGWPEHVSI